MIFDLQSLKPLLDEWALALRALRIRFIDLKRWGMDPLSPYYCKTIIERNELENPTWRP